ncbi:MAG TPA: ROK family protein [Terriglobia bacterium]|nr:ROK family protein [Terriglobia bacterium]
MPDSETTEQLAFRAIARHGESSRAGLRRALGLESSTLDRKLRTLERKGLVRIDAKSGTLSVSPEFGRVVGIDMGASNLRFALADFRGDILAHTTQKVRPEDGPVRMIAQIKEGIRRLAEAPLAVNESHPAESRPPKRGHRGHPLALAIGVPSPVDPRTGLVAFANNLRGWKNVDLRRALEKEFRVPVSLENDANMAAIGEHWRGVAHDANNFVFLALGTGTGSGIFTNGMLYRGRTGNAGELFRLNLEWPRWDEDFGDLGYFESQVSGLGIAAAGRKMLGPLASSDERDARFVFEAAGQGNMTAQAVLDKAFTMMGVAVADLVAILDPDLIVFGGGVTNGDPELLLDTVTRVVRRIHPQAPQIKLSALKDKAQTYGAIFSALSLAHEAVARRLES